MEGFKFKNPIFFSLAKLLFSDGSRFAFRSVRLTQQILNVYQDIAAGLAGASCLAPLVAAGKGF